MSTMKMAAAVLVVAGILGLAYGGFSYMGETHEANIGSLHMSVNERHHVHIPVWAGLGALLAGGVLFATAVRRPNPKSGGR
jgi:TRAP-type C4-dicarboxylate transport system permease small subunit